jgi:hypothetical protein
VGYLPEVTAADACYKEAKYCDFGILIVGKRYGDEHKEGCSVTHNEYRMLVGEKIPIITLVERDILSYRAVFVANPSPPKTVFPGMDQPEKTFGLLAEVTMSAQNNGIGEFTHIGDARAYIRKQLAHIFGNLLRNTNGSVNADVKDVLAELRSLKNEITKGEQKDESIKFLRVARAFLEDDRKHFRELLQYLYGNADQPVKAIIENESFEALLKSAGWILQIVASIDEFNEKREKVKNGLKFMKRWTSGTGTTVEHPISFECALAICSPRLLIVTESALSLFQGNHKQCRDALTT